MAAFLLFLLLALAASNSKHGGEAAAADDEIILVDLRGSPETTTMAVLRHDLSIAGFTDGSIDWHAFQGHEHLIPSSTPLPFGSGYSELIGGLANLPGVPLGRDAMVQAVRVLSAYRPGADVEPVKRALAVAKVLVTESGRLKPISDTVQSGWLSESRVAAEHLAYIEHWDTMSYEILRSNRTGGKWDGPFTKMLATQANIRSQEEALAVMNVLMDADFEQVLKAHAIKIKI